MKDSSPGHNSEGPYPKNSATPQDEFPRPCRNCGNKVYKNAKGKLVHVYRGSDRCNIFRPYTLERDANGQVCKMSWSGDVVIPDPEGNEELEQRKLREWNELYRS